MTEQQLQEIEARAKVATCKADIESVYPAVCAVVFEDIPALVASVRRLREGLEEVERLKDSIRDGGLCDSGSPYLDGRLRAFKEAGSIAHRALHPEEEER